MLTFHWRTSAPLKVVFDPRKVDPTQKVKICTPRAAERFDPTRTASKIEPAVDQSREKIGIKNVHSRAVAKKRVFDLNLASGDGFDVRELDRPAEFTHIVSCAFGRKWRAELCGKRTCQHCLACTFAAANDDPNTGLIARSVMLCCCHSGSLTRSLSYSLVMLPGFLQGCRGSRSS